MSKLGYWMVTLLVVIWVILTLYVSSQAGVEASVVVQALSLDWPSTEIATVFISVVIVVSTGLLIALLLGLIYILVTPFIH